MAFQVDIADPALADAEDYVPFIRDVRRETEAASRWFRGLVQAIYSLEELPDCCAVIPEQEDFSLPIELSFAVERDKNRVVIYRVYYSSREMLTPQDLP